MHPSIVKEPFRKWCLAHPGTLIQNWLQWKFAVEEAQSDWAYGEGNHRDSGSYGYVLH
jgi:hypothetical protein